MVSVEKPGSPLEVLEHFGTKGMKWGVRRTKGTLEFKKNFPSSSQRTQEIHRARASVNKTRAAVGRAKSKEERKKLADIHLKNPDHATALRLTKGEKVVAGLLYAMVPTVVVPVTTAAVVTTRVGKRRALEK